MTIALKNKYLIAEHKLQLRFHITNELKTLAYAEGDLEVQIFKFPHKNYSLSIIR